MAISLNVFWRGEVIFASFVCVGTMVKRTEKATYVNVLTYFMRLFICSNVFGLAFQVIFTLHRIDRYTIAEKLCQWELQ